MTYTETRDALKSAWRGRHIEKLTAKVKTLYWEDNLYEALTGWYIEEECKGDTALAMALKELRDKYARVPAVYDDVVKYKCWNGAPINNEDINLLSCAIIMSANHWKSEAESWAKLAEDTTGKVHETAKSNAEYFAQLPDRLDEIKAKLDNMRYIEPEKEEE